MNCCKQCETNDAYKPMCMMSSCKCHNSNPNKEQGWRERWEQERTDAISEMFDNVSEEGIYPTTKFFTRIGSFIAQEIAQAEKRGGDRAMEMLLTLPDEAALAVLKEQGITILTLDTLKAARNLSSKEK